MNITNVANHLHATGLRILFLISAGLFPVGSVFAMDHSDITFEDFSDEFSAGNVFTASVYAFEVTDYLVTQGQDSNIQKVSYLLDYRLDARVLTVRADRKASSEVAQWYKRNLGYDKNFTIFDHWPGKLNWAIKGNLTISAGTEYVIRDIVIGHGHSLLANNAWIGGEGCFHPDGQTDSLSCFADGPNGEKRQALVTFRRKAVENPETFTISDFGLTY